MDVTKTLKPGDHGITRMLRKYGERLVCVYYRLDPARKKNLTPVELIIEKHGAPGGYHPLSMPRPVTKQRVLVRVDFSESGLRTQVKENGGLWNPQRRGWFLPFATVREMGVVGRIVEENVP